MDDTLGEPAVFAAGVRPDYLLATLQKLVDKFFEINRSIWASPWHERRVEVAVAVRAHRTLTKLGIGEALGTLKVW